MKAFYFSFMGVILALFCFTIFYSQYADYRGETIMRYWIKETMELRVEIEKSFKQTSLLPQAVQLMKHKSSIKFADTFDIFNSSVMVIQNKKRGYLLIIFPEIEKQQLIWHCYASSQKTVVC